MNDVERGFSNRLIDENIVDEGNKLEFRVLNSEVITCSQVNCGF